MSEEMSKPLDNLSGAAVRGEAVAKAATDQLYGAVMNIPCKMGRATAMHGATKQAYQEGHRDARHAAADLVAAFSSSARAADAPSEPREPQQQTIACMDAWAASAQMPTYSELHSLTEQYDALIRKICFQYAAGGYNSDGFMAPKSADLKLRWIINEAYNAKSRAADALDHRASSAPAAPIAPDGWKLEGYYRKNGKHFDRLKSRPNDCTLSSGWVAHYVPAPQQEGSEAGNGN